MTPFVVISAVLALAAAPALAANADEATVKVTITNAGNDVKGYGTFSVHPAGQRGKQVAASSSGATVTIPAGDYEIRVRYSEGAASKEIWLPKESLFGRFEKSVELNLPLTKVTFRITNNGEDAGYAGTYTLYSPGDRKKELGYAASGESATIPAGVYDVLLRLSDGAKRKSVWMLKQQLEGPFEQTMEMGPLPFDPPPKTTPPDPRPIIVETRPLISETIPTETLPAIETRPVLPETAPAVLPETIPVAPPETQKVLPPWSSLPKPPEFLIPVPGRVPQTAAPSETDRQPGPGRPAGKGWFGCGLVREQ